MNRHYLRLLALSAVLITRGVAAEEQSDLVDVQTINPNIEVSLYFASADNFAHRAFYDSSARAYLKHAPAQALSRVEEELEQLGLGLLILDAYRPLSIQKVMWAACPNPDYVIDPATASRHNYGNAVDVLLINKADGTIACMPTKYFATPASRDCKNCCCSLEAKKNCKLLELIMEKHGFKGLETEWWHFDFGTKEQYQVLDISFQELSIR